MERDSLLPHQMPGTETRHTECSPSTAEREDPCHLLLSSSRGAASKALWSASGSCEDWLGHQAGHKIEKKTGSPVADPNRTRTATLSNSDYDRDTDQNHTKTTDWEQDWDDNQHLPGPTALHQLLCRVLQVTNFVLHGSARQGKLEKRSHSQEEASFRMIWLLILRLTFRKPRLLRVEQTTILLHRQNRYFEKDKSCREAQTM